MFSYLSSVKKFNNKTLNIKQLVDIVKNNPQKHLIDKIRSVEYKSKEYNNLKLGINCIMPHGLFKGLLNDDIISFSNYLFYDVDGINNTNELNDIIQNLIDTFPISFLQRSVSNKGFHFLIKVDDIIPILIDTNSFNNIYKYVRYLLIKKGFNIDNGASGISRKMIISSDDKVYYNNDVSLKLNKELLDKWLNDVNSLNKVKIKTSKEENKDIGPIDTIKIINIETLLKEIKTETKYKKPINGDFIIDDMEYYKIIIPRIIKDGYKHKIFSRIINALYYINGTKITKQQVYSYIYHINNTISNKMNERELLRMVTYICNNIESTGEIRIKNRIKKLHFNINCKLNKNQKMSMGAQLSAKIRNNKTIELIIKAKDELSSRNEVISQSKVQRMTGLGIATVKRNWNKELHNLQDIELTYKIDDDNENNEIIIKESITEESFFQEEPKIEIVKHKYKGFKDVFIERSSDDKKLFKSVLNDIQNRFGDISEDLVHRFMTNNNWDKYKIDYFYSNYQKQIQN